MSTTERHNADDATSSNSELTNYRLAADHQSGETCPSCGARLGFTTIDGGTTVLICPGCGKTGGGA